MDDGDTYELQCRADDSLCNAKLITSMGAISDKPPETTVFEDISETTEFVLELDGSCGFNFAQKKLSFQ